MNELKQSSTIGYLRIKVPDVQATDIMHSHCRKQLLTAFSIQVVDLLDVLALLDWLDDQVSVTIFPFSKYSDSAAELDNALV